MTSRHRVWIGVLAVVVALLLTGLVVSRTSPGAALVERARTFVSCLGSGDPRAPGGRWCPTYRQDFTVPVGVGGFTNATSDDWFLSGTNPYESSMRSYPDGWPTTGDLSLNLPSRTADVAEAAEGAQGVFRLRARTEVVDDRPQALGGSFYPVIRPDVSPERDQTSQLYGRYTVRFKTIGGYAPGSDPGAPATPTEGRYGTAFLLWPADDHWPDGEVDFPEMGWGDRIQGHVHVVGQPDLTSADFGAPTSSDQWSTATIEWSPGLLVFVLDGAEVFRTTQDVPSVPMRWGFQSGATLATPAPEITGQLLVDWIRIDAFVPERGSP